MENHTARTGELIGQAFVEKLSRDTLDQVRLNHDQGTNYVRVDLKNQANAEKNTVREYRERYVFELLQNANDAIRDARDQEGIYQRRTYRVRLDLTATALIISNDGVPFLEKDVESIYMWGESSKDPNKSIGYKGIGFKSVLEITESWQIFSQVVQFHFDRATCYEQVSAIVKSKSGLKLPITRFVFPYSIQQVPQPDQGLVEQLLNGKGYATVIRLPLLPKVKQENVLAQIDRDLDPALLLFLNGIDEIEVWVKGKRRRSLSRKVRAHQQTLGQDVTLYIDKQPVSRWLLFDSPKVRMPVDTVLLEDLHDDVWKRVKQVGFSLAFPLDNEGRLHIEETVSKFHVYFPTGLNTGLRYRIHADFYIDAARKTIPDLPYNGWLARQVAAFLKTKVIPELVRRFPSDEHLVQALTPIEPPRDFADVFYQAVRSAITNCEFVPTTEKKPASPARILLAPNGVWSDIATFHKFFPESELLHCKSGRFYFPLPELYSDDDSLQFLSDLGAKQLSFRDVFKQLDNYCPVKTSSEYASFYEFLWRWREALDYTEKPEFIETLQDSRCIVTSNNEWIRPHERLYHAKLKLETPIMPRIIRADLVHPDAYTLDGREGSTFQLLATFSPKIREYDAPDIIRNAVLPLFKGATFRNLRVDQRVEVYRYLFDYWKGRRGGDPEVDQMIGQVQVPAFLISDRRKMVWKPASEIYLSSEWTNDNRLEMVYAGFEDVAFLYGVNGLDIQLSEQREWARFWEWMGISSLPRCIVKEFGKNDLKIGWFWSNLRKNHPQAHEQLWSDYITLLENEHSTCPYHGKGYLRLRRSITIDHLSEILASNDPRRLIAFYGLLSEHWSSFRSDSQATLECYRAGDYTTEKVGAYWLFAIRKHRWIPASTTVDGGEPKYDFYKPTECWVVASAEEPVVRCMLPTPPTELGLDNRTFCREIGMRFMDEAKINDLVDILTNLPIHYPDPNITIQSGRRPVRRAVAALTRWVIGRINNLLLQADHQSPAIEPISLVAQQGDDLRYIGPPDPVYYADDRYHSPRWREHLPFAPLDDDWRDAARFLGLKFLSDHVQEDVDPGVILEEETQNLERRFKSARPYMLALVADQRGSSLQDVARYFANLEIQVVDSLVVNRRVTIGDGKVIPDPAARVFLSESIGARTGSAGRAPRVGKLFVSNDFRQNYDLLGSPIANYIRIPGLADAFVILMDRGYDGRKRYLEARGLGDDTVQEMRALLRQEGTLEVEEEQSDDEGIPEKRDALRKSLLDQLRKSSNEESADTSGERPGRDTSTPGEESQSPPEGDQSTPPAPPIQFPELDISGIRVTAIDNKNLVAPESPPNRSKKRGSRQGWRPNWERDEKLRDAYGARGEEVVYKWELDRLQKLGLDTPEDRVRWLRILGDLTADHDLESLDLVDGDWVDIIIEVKATPNKEFLVYMSREELECALKAKESYRLYRVIDVASSTPEIFIYENPYTLWEKGLALIEPRDTSIILPNPVQITEREEI